MSDTLRKPWLEKQLLAMLANADSMRMPFTSTGYLQIRVFHSYRFEEDSDRHNPDELISADVSDKFCEIRCVFSLASEEKFRKEKSWRLTQLRGAILSKIRGHLRIAEGSGSRSLECLLEIDSFNVPGGFDGGAIFGEPERFNEKRTARQLLDSHRIIGLAGSPPTDDDEIRSQAHQSSSDSGEDGEDETSATFSTQVQAPLVLRNTLRPSSVVPYDFTPNKRRKIESPSPTNRSATKGTGTVSHATKPNTSASSVNRKRLHSGWGDFNGLTYYDCRIPAAQQKILESESCWMPQGDYVIEPIKYRSRKQAPVQDLPAKGKQQRLALGVPAPLEIKSTGRPMLTNAHDSPSTAGSSHEDDAISWTSSPERTTLPRTQRSKLSVLRAQTVCHDPPPDSSPIGSESPRLPAKHAQLLAPLAFDGDSEVDKDLTADEALSPPTAPPIVSEHIVPAGMKGVVESQDHGDAVDDSNLYETLIDQVDVNVPLVPQENAPREQADEDMTNSLSASSVRKPNPGEVADSQPSQQTAQPVAPSAVLPDREAESSEATDAPTIEHKSSIGALFSENQLDSASKESEAVSNVVTDPVDCQKPTTQPASPAVSSSTRTGAARSPEERWYAIKVSKRQSTVSEAATVPDQQAANVSGAADPVTAKPSIAVDTPGISVDVDQVAQDKPNEGTNFVIRTTSDCDESPVVVDDPSTTAAGIVSPVDDSNTLISDPLPHATEQVYQGPPEMQAQKSTRRLPWQAVSTTVRLVDQNPDRKSSVNGGPFRNPYEFAARRTSSSPRSTPSGPRTTPKTAARVIRESPHSDSQGGQQRTRISPKVSPSRAISSHKSSQNAPQQTKYPYNFASSKLSPRPSAKGALSTPSGSAGRSAIQSRLLLSPQQPDTTLETADEAVEAIEPIQTTQTLSVSRDPLTDTQSLAKEVPNPIRPESRSRLVFSHVLVPPSRFTGRVPGANHLRKTSKVMKLNFEKLRQDDDGMDVQDILRQDLARFMQLRKPPPQATKVVTEIVSPVPQIASEQGSSEPRRTKRKAEEMEVDGASPHDDLALVDERDHATHASQGLQSPVGRVTGVPVDADPRDVGESYPEDSDTPLRTLLRTTFKLRGDAAIDPHYDVLAWRSRMDDLDLRNRKRNRDRNRDRGTRR